MRDGGRTDRPPAVPHRLGNSTTSRNGREMPAPNVPGAGLEPTWGCPQGILSPPRLPISPPGRDEVRVGESRVAVSRAVRALDPSNPRSLDPGSQAGNGTRTRDPNLGKVVLYHLSYSRDKRKLVLTLSADKHHGITDAHREHARRTRGPTPRAPTAQRRPRWPSPGRWHRRTRQRDRDRAGRAGTTAPRPPRRGQ